MSDQNNEQNSMNAEMNEMDLDALFGAATPPQIDLGDTATTCLVAPVGQPTMQMPQAVPPVSTQPQAVLSPQAAMVQPVPQPTAAPQSQPVPAPTAPQSRQVVDLFGAVVAESEEDNVARLMALLANKAPVFESGSIRNEITDPEMTFEQLRVKMSADLPELETRSHVSWSVSYNGVTERIADPDKATVFSVKSKIEHSKKFKDTLKKRKESDKEPVCSVRPTVTAQKKGVLPFPPYKTMCETMSQAENAGKAIVYMPSQGGRIYEMRCNEIGTFVAPAKYIAECEDIRAGVTMRLPRIPAKLLVHIITFFRAVCSQYGDYEALVNVFWDKEQHTYMLHVPPQYVSHVRVETDLTEQPDPNRYLHVMDVHSHNTMAARFSEIDDKDEQATRLYMVIGRLDRYFPEVCCRFACGGQHMVIPADRVCERMSAPFDPGWFDAIYSGKKEAA